MKQQIETIFAEYQDKVSNCISSIFSKSDVLMLMADMKKKLEEIEPPVQKINVQDIEDAINDIDAGNFIRVERSTASFYLSGNEIELDDVEFEVDAEDLACKIYDYINDKNN